MTPTTVLSPPSKGASAATSARTATAGAGATDAAPADAFAALLLALGAGEEGATALPLAEPGEVLADEETLPAASAQPLPEPATAGAFATALPVPSALPAMMLALAAASPRTDATAAPEQRGGQGDAPAAAVASPANTPGKARTADLPPLAAVTDPASAAPAAKPEFAALVASAAASDRPATAEPVAARAPELPALSAAHLPAGAAATIDTPAATVPVHQAALPSHPLDTAFAGDIAAEVKLMADGGLQQAELHLNPAELGPVRIQLSLTAQTADLSFTAAHATTREGLTQALPALRELLASQGLQLGQAGVGSGGTGDGARGADWQAARQAQGERTGGRASLEGLGAAAPSATVLVRRGRGMVDLYA